ncbi:MAG: HPr family phosphocarrier protein [Myxococcales bacterium]|nr:HPr family phosphocarrier protein [Myxococcales bacterium]
MEPPQERLEDPPQEWLEKSIEVRCPKGLHMRPASAIAKLARTFDAEVLLCSKDLEASATSVMKLLQLEACPGTFLQLRARGPDASAALQAIGAQLQSLEPHSR